MMRTGISSMLLGAVLLTGLLTGCKQGLGERCQIDDDCATDLICSFSGTREVGGYCISTTPTTIPTVDLAGTPPDMTATPPDMTATPPDLRGTD